MEKEVIFIIIAVFLVIMSISMAAIFAHFDKKVRRISGLIWICALTLAGLVALPLGDNGVLIVVLGLFAISVFIAVGIKVLQQFHDQKLF